MYLTIAYFNIMINIKISKIPYKKPPCIRSKYKCKTSTTSNVPYNKK